MNDIVLFIIGAIIFLAYLIGLLRMVNRQHKIQEEQFPKEDFEQKD